MQSEIPNYVSVEQAAAVLGMSTRGVRKLIERGKLPAKRAGAWFIHQATLDKIAKQPPKTGRPRQGFRPERIEQT